MRADYLPLYMKIERFIDEFGMCRSKVYKLLGAGKLRAKKNGKTVLIETASGVEYMNSLPSPDISCGKRDAESVAA